MNGYLMNFLKQPLLSKEEAFNELKKATGTQFDPEVVDAFIKVLKRI